MIHDMDLIAKNATWGSRARSNAWVEKFDATRRKCVASESTWQ